MSEVAAFFSCGVTDVCPKGGAHQWDGPEKTWTDSCASCYGEGKKLDAEGNATDETCRLCKGSGRGCSGSSATCSKCGVDAMSHSLWTDP
jgi:hypothetical protein